MKTHLQKYWKQWISLIIGFYTMTMGSGYCIFVIEKDWGILLGSLILLIGFVIIILSIPADIGSPHKRISMFLFETGFFTFFIMLTISVGILNLLYYRLGSLTTALVGAVCIDSGLILLWLYLKTQWFQKEEQNSE